MNKQENNNSYARFLSKQRKYLINIAGVDWFDYNGFLTPAYLPHCIPIISRESAREAMRESRRPFARWSSGFGKVENSEWWCILKRGPWSIDDIRDRDKRYKIRKGKRHFTVRPLTSAEVISECPRITKLAAARYITKVKLENSEWFKNSVAASREVPGVIEYIGCFHNDVMVSFAENYIQDGGVFCNIIRHDPKFLKENSSYALIDGMLSYYLNEKKFEYFSNGWRNIYHDTELFEHLISVFGYTKEYLLLDVVYQPWFEIGVKAAYYFKSSLWNIDANISNSMLDKVGGILRQEYIRRSCLASTLV